MYRQPGNNFDVIVIGIGSMGASTCYYLAKRGYRVLGLEQFDIPHEQGSHAGQSRIIRKAYFEDPDYVPLLARAYDNWTEIEEETGNQLYYRTGLVYFGKPDNILITGVKLSASQYHIPLEKLTPATLAIRYPQFRIPLEYEALFEPEAGFVVPEKSILLYTKQAVKSRAEIHTKEKVLSWNKDGAGIIVTTDKYSYHSDKLIITAGAWAGKIIPALQDKIKVTRQVIAWVKTKQPGNYTAGKFPCWMIAHEENPGAYYGFPVLPINKFGGPDGLKLAYHYPGAITDPDNVNRQTNAKELTDLANILDRYLPGDYDSFAATRTCLYANSPDENFIIDKLPNFEDRVTIACGFSGHGFKFVSVVGEILADLAIKGETSLPIGFLNLNRFL